MNQKPTKRLIYFGIICIVIYLISYILIDKLSPHTGISVEISRFIGFIELALSIIFLAGYFMIGIGFSTRKIKGILYSFVLYALTGVGWLIYFSFLDSKFFLLSIFTTNAWISCLIWPFLIPFVFTLYIWMPIFILSIIIFLGFCNFVLKNLTS